MVSNSPPLIEGAAKRLRGRNKRNHNRRDRKTQSHRKKRKKTHLKQQQQQQQQQHEQRQQQQQDTQKSVWNELTTEHTSMIAAFLSVKEIAAVRSVSKTWREGSTLGVTDVMIRPGDVRWDLDGSLRFVASSFPCLRHFSMRITNEDFWDEGFLLVGASMKRVFGQKSLCLRSATIHFDEGLEPLMHRVFDKEWGWFTLHRQVSLQTLDLVYPFFKSIRVLSQAIRPLVNLQQLRLCGMYFLESEYASNDENGYWRNSSRLMKTIGSLHNLRSLVITDHRITDNEIYHLSTLPELRELSLVRHIPGGVMSLTDTSMTFIASTFPKLEALDVSYNRSITMKGLWKVIHSCPLQRLEAYETGVGAEHLDQIVVTKPSLRLICHRMDRNENFLEQASIISKGRCIFASILGVYEPRFDPDIFANHNATKKECDFLKHTTSYSQLRRILGNRHRR